MNREIREAIRYLGYGRHAIDEQTLALVECSMEELKAKVRERFIYRIFELSQKDGVLQIGDWTIESKGLSRNLKGCGRVAAFAATLGTEADQMIRRASVMEMAKAVVLQSCAAALRGGVLRRLPGRDRKRTILRGLVSETKIQSWLRRL